MNDAEKEAEDILFTAGRNMKYEYGFHESAKNEIAQALQKKQDEILETKKLGYAQIQVLKDEIERLTARNKELESKLAGARKALKLIANAPLDTQMDDWYSDTAKDALAELEEK